MRAGQLRTRASIYRIPKPHETTQNAFGEDIQTPTLLGTFSMQITPMGGEEYDAQSQTFARARFMVTMRVQPSILFRSSDQIWWGGSPVRVLDILNVEDIDQRQRELRLTCQEVA